MEDPVEAITTPDFTMIYEQDHVVAIRFEHNRSSVAFQLSSHSRSRLRHAVTYWNGAKTISSGGPSGNEEVMDL